LRHGGKQFSYLGRACRVVCSGGPKGEPLRRGKENRGEIPEDPSFSEKHKVPGSQRGPAMSSPEEKEKEEENKNKQKRKESKGTKKGGRRSNHAEK